jgi:RNA polymerase sigma factor (sigma-70 family)
MLDQDDPTYSTALLSLAEFTALIERHQGELFGFLRSLVQHQEQASDLLQDTFIDAWRAAQQGQAPLVPGAAREGVRRWLFRAAYCQAISALRRRQLIRWESLDAPGAVQWEALSSLASFEDQVVESAAMQAALADLATRDVTCLLLHVVEGFTAAEAAEIMGDSPQAVAKRITRAKHRLLTAYLAHEAGDQRSRHL